MMDDGNFADRLVYSDSGDSDAEISSAQKFQEPIEDELVETIAKANSDDDEEPIKLNKTKKLTRNAISSDDEGNSADDNEECVESTSDGSGENMEESAKMSETKPKRKKILKSKSELNKKLTNKHEESSSSSEDENDADGQQGSEARKRTNLNELCDVESSLSSNSEPEVDNSGPPPKREKCQQRKSAKRAEDDIKEIQSESQRMARNIYINVPYHKPKQHSLQEFLNRRSLGRQKEGSKPTANIKAAAAIKMSNDELVLYAQKLEQRAKEAIEFFENDDGDEGKSCEETSVPTPAANENKNEDAGHSHVTEAVEDGRLESDFENQVNEDAGIAKCLKTDSNTGSAEVAVGSKETEHGAEESVDGNVVLLHSCRTDLDNELDKLISEERKRNSVARSLCIGRCSAPKLHGDKNMIIDLETNEIKTREKSGVEDLQERFLSHAIKKPTREKHENELSVFNPDFGGIETIKSSTNSEPKPGQAYFSLKEELSKKMNEKRRESLAKRIEEEKRKQKEMEIDDEEQYLDDESETDENDDEEQDAMEKHGEKEKLDEVEAAGDESDGDDVEEGEADGVDQPPEKPRPSRIVRAFEDSDEEEPRTAHESHPETVEENAHDNSFDEVSHQTGNNRSISEDLKAIESKLFDVNTQKTQTEQSATTKLYEDPENDGEMDESQLMALCSGAFITQKPGDPQESSLQSFPGTNAKTAFLSSDEEEETSSKAGQWHKNNKKLNFSDDEDDAEDIGTEKGSEAESREDGNEFDRNAQEEAKEQGDEKEEEEEEGEEDSDDEERVEKYIEYDSDENEIEICLEKQDLRRKATEFVENEAELSESEWGSADEDEKNLDEFEQELGDEDEFDQHKLQSELERIRLRQQTDQDAREVRILKEMFIEEEDGEMRERKFRWKNMDVSLDMAGTVADNEEQAAENSDDENEEEWRRLRYERDQLLIKQNAATTVQSTTTEIVEESIADTDRQTNSSAAHRRMTTCKAMRTSTSNISSPFLLSLNGSASAGRKSFLNRDNRTLEKLASFTKSSADGEVIKTSNKQNYVFVATEKPNQNKRRSDDTAPQEPDSENRKKKQKLSERNGRSKQCSKGFLELLSK